MRYEVYVYGGKRHAEKIHQYNTLEEAQKSFFNKNDYYRRTGQRGVNVQLNDLLECRTLKTFTTDHVIC